jgi:hypothetical protein
MHAGSSPASLAKSTVNFNSKFPQEPDQLACQQALQEKTQNI